MDGEPENFECAILHRLKAFCQVFACSLPPIQSEPDRNLPCNREALYSYQAAHAVRGEVESSKCNVQSFNGVPIEGKDLNATEELYFIDIVVI